MHKSRQTSETFLIGALLATVGGWLDAYTYVCRDHVFANAQTGNMVLFGINLAGGHWNEAFYYFAPIIAFFLGVVVAEMTRNKFHQKEKIHWRQIILLIETLVLAAVAFIPQGKANMLANVLISFVSSLQVDSFRKMNGSNFVTTMCTGNLRSATEHLYSYRITKDKTILMRSLSYYGIILFFIAGAAVGAIVTNALSVKSVLFACIGLAAAFLIMLKKEF